MATAKKEPANVAPPDEDATEPAAPLEVEPEAPPKPAPRNVIEAIARVELEIGGIRKLTPEQRRKLTGVAGEKDGISFAYRGIDQIAAAAQQLFGEYGVVIVPNIVSMDVEKVLKGFNATMDTTTWTRTTLTVRYDLYGPGGVDDMISSTVIGVGDDNSDKGANKAATGAFKNLLLRILCIGDPQDDTDQYQNPNPDAGQPAAPPADPIKTLFERVKSYAGTPFADEMMDAAKASSLKLTEKNLKDNTVLRTKITEILDAADSWAEQERAREAEESNDPTAAVEAAEALAADMLGAEAIEAGWDEVAEGAARDAQH